MAKAQTAQRLINAVAERRRRIGRPARLGRKLSPEQRERRRQEALDILWDALPMAARVLADEAAKGNFQAAVRVMEVVMGAKGEAGQNVELLAAMQMLARALEADAAIQGTADTGPEDAGAGVQEEAVRDSRLPAAPGAVDGP